VRGADAPSAADGKGSARAAAARKRRGRAARATVQMLQRSAAGSSRQMQTILRDEASGLGALRAGFLPQLEHEAYGGAVEKLRYIQLVFKQCGDDVDAAARWLVSRGASMLTPQQALELAHLELRWPSAPATDLATMLRVLGTPERVRAHLVGELELSPYDEMRLEVESRHAETRAALTLVDTISGRR
jgi:hypothetical protein